MLLLRLRERLQSRHPVALLQTKWTPYLVWATNHMQNGNNNKMITQKKNIILITSSCDQRGYYYNMMTSGSNRAQLCTGKAGNRHDQNIYF